MFAPSSLGHNQLELNTPLDSALRATYKWIRQKYYAWNTGK